jgi:hypothetical protein
MNASYRRVPTNFAPEARFEIKLRPPAATLEGRLEALKNQLLAKRLDQLHATAFDTPVRRAANEAAALAAVTGYPLLVFPALFEEKADAALSQARPQGVCRCGMQSVVV